MTFGSLASYLCQRFGGTVNSRPQLPLLPLGVDQLDLLAQTNDQKSRRLFASLPCVWIK